MGNMKWLGWIVLAAVALAAVIFGVPLLMLMTGH
jgi:hypothetical protein